jgi:hypothetical protein
MEYGRERLNARYYFNCPNESLWLAPYRSRGSRKRGRIVNWSQSG